MNLVILDRDGVINYDSEAYIKSPAEWRPIPGSLAAIARLTQAGYRIAVATNQSGIARHYYSLGTLNQIHQKMHDLVQAAGGRIDAIFYCPHGPTDNCDCRKPKPGLLKHIQQHFNVDLTQVPFIGDSLRDIEAARAMACQAILVKTGYGAKTVLENQATLEGILVFADLAEAVNHLLTVAK